MSRPPLYILDADQRVVKAADGLEWRLFFEKADRQVAHNIFGHEAIGEIEVSTVFLGINHRFGDDGPPLVFETMIFGGGDGLNGYTDRCSTWADAEAMHAKAVQHVKNAFSELAKASGA